MPANEDLLYGKIAISKSFCTQTQVDECLNLQLQIQSPHQAAPRLGELLLNKGYITQEQHGKVMEVQRQNLQLIDPVLKRRKEAVLLGKLAVRDGLLTEDEVNECLRLQAAEGETRSLGEIMVAQGYLTPSQIKGLLAKQLKKIMSCPACKLSFTVLTLSEGKKIDCPRCGGPLRDGKPGESVRTDAEFATPIMKAIKQGPPPPPPPKPPPTLARKVKARCVICDEAFEGHLDSTGRVRCPACHTTFTPK
jgi:DNA-directed RNA polymerase subunit RPC12/RpoP